MQSFRSKQSWLKIDELKLKTRTGSEMFVKTAYFLLACIICLNVTSALSEPVVAERPTFTPGDVWRYDFRNKRYAKPGCKYEVVVEQVTDTNVLARVNYPDGCEVSVTTVLPVAPGSLQKFDLGMNHYFFSEEPYRAFDFPLFLGKSWTQKWVFKANGWTYNDEVVGKVEAFEKVTTPAGTFDTFRIHLTRIYLGTNTGRPTQSGILKDTFWYSPQVKNFVKRSYIDPGWSNITRELVDFSVQ